MKPPVALMHPLLHFLLIGALLFTGQQLLARQSAPQLQTIHVSAADLLRLRGEWRRETTRAPSDSEMRSSVQRHVDEELMLREALRLGLDATDPVARQRLVMNMQFAFPQSGKSEAQLLSEARNLGMATRDLVVRRRLVQVMEMRIVGQANLGEDALRAYVAKHPERYARPARYTFRHVFFSADRSPEEPVHMVLAQLNSINPPSVTGDPFLLGGEFPLLSESEIARHFGTEFAQSLVSTPQGRWGGPLRSPYGLHLVQLINVESARPQDFERVRDRAAYALLTEREARVLRDKLTQLRLNYRVVLPPMDTPADLIVGRAP